MSSLNPIRPPTIATLPDPLRLREIAQLDQVAIPAGSTATGTGSLSSMCATRARRLAVTDLTVDGLAQPIALATGRSPLAIVNPQTGQVLFNGAIATADGTALNARGATRSARRRSPTLVGMIRGLRLRRALLYQRWPLVAR